ncbi:zinc finger, C3HC4 type [Ostertagia ostertagi]
MSEENVGSSAVDDRPARQPDTDIATNVDENASDSNSVKSAALVDLHACGICYQLYNDSERLPKVLSCGHTNCLTCLNSWQKHGSSPFPICAVCRKVTRRPINSLPNNFQLLQVLRRMKLISTDSGSQTAEQQQQSTAQVEEMAPGITAVCEQIDEFDRLLRTVENASADLLSRWDMTKRHLLHTKKVKSRTSSSLPPFFSGYSGLTDLFGIGRRYDEIRTDPASDDPFERIHDFLGLDSDTPPNAYSDFSLFGSETSHETAVSASEESSQENENFPTFVEPREQPAFLHISTFDGTFGSYSYCRLCHCRLPTTHDSHRVHVLGRRHQYALQQSKYSGFRSEETSLMLLTTEVVRLIRTVVLRLAEGDSTGMEETLHERTQVHKLTMPITLPPIRRLRQREPMLMLLRNWEAVIVPCRGIAVGHLRELMVKLAVTDAGILDSLLPLFGAAPAHRGNYSARRNNRAVLTGRTPLATPHGGYHMPFLVLNEPNIGFLSGTGFFSINNGL